MDFEEDNKRLKDEIQQLNNIISELNDKLEFHELFFENSNHWETFIDKSGKLIYISSGIESITGFNKEEFIKNNGKLNEIIHPDDRNFALEIYKKQLSGEEINNQILRIYDAKKNLKYISISTKPVFSKKSKYLGYRTSCTNVTDTVLTQNELKQSYERTNALLFATPDIIFRIDRHGNFIDYKAEKNELYYQDSDIIGLNARDILPEEIFNLSIINIEKTLLTSELQTFEYNFILPDGKKGFYECRMTKCSENEVIAIVRDITERKLNEQILKQSEERFRHISITISDIAYSCIKNEKNEYQISWIAGATERITGYTYQEFLEMKCWGHIVEPTDFSIFKNKILKLKQGENSYCELRIRNKAGDLIWVCAYTECAISEDNQHVLYGALIDITQRKKDLQALKESEELWKFALEGNDDGVWDWNLKTNDVFYSQGWKKMLGYSDNEIENSLNEWEIRVHPDDLQKSNEDLQKYFSKQTPIYKNIHRIKCKDNSYKWVLDRGKIMTYADDGTPLRMVGTHTDLTERIELEQQLNELLATKDKFFSIIAHDLKNPFNAIIGFIELLISNVKNNDFSKVETFAEYIQSASTNAYDLLNNLLEWSRSQTGNILYKPENFVLYDVVSEVVKLHEPSAAKKNIKVLVEIDKSVVINADKYMITTVIRNLISNAIKFSFNDNFVYIFASEKDNEIILTVKDNGIGISESNIEKLFKLESHYSTLGTNKEKGTGLGLILCKEFIEKNNGKIWVESTEGKGSEFKLAIPL